MADLNLENIDLGSFGINEEKETQLNATMSEAVKVNPDQHAQTVKLSQASGVPEFAVQSNPEQVEHKLKLDQINLEGMTTRAPKTSNFLTSNVNNAVIAQEDVTAGLLEGIEKTFDGLGGAIEIGFGVQGRGLLLSGNEATSSRIDDLIPMGAMPMGMEFEAQRLSRQMAANFGIETDEQLQQAKTEASDRLIGEIQTLQKERQNLTPEDMNIVQEGVRAGVESIANMAPGLGLTLLSGGRAAPLLVTIGAQTFSGSYGEGRAEGLSVEEARWYAGIDAAIEVGTELLPLGTLEKIVTGKSKGLTKSALKFAVQEMGTEQLATALQTVNSYMFGLDKELENATGAQEVIEIQMRRQAVTAIATVVAGGSQITAATAVNKTVEKLTQTEQQAETQASVEQSNIDKLSADSVKSKLRERDVESFKQFVREADGENNTNVFIDGVQTSLYLQGKTREEIDADPALKVLDNAVRESRATGADVAIPVDQFMGDVAGTEAFTELRDHMTMSEETVSPFRQEQHKVETQNYVKSLLDEANENASEYVEAQEIYTQVRDQLVDTGVVSPANASTMAQIVPAWATAQARRTGRTVQEVYESAGLVIEGPQTGERARLEGEQVLEQPVQTARDVQKSLTEEFDGVKLSLSGTGDNVTLNKIIVPEDQRGQGTGSQVMQRVLDWADQNGKTVALTPSKDFGGTVPRLKSFYKNFGFVENKGRNKDFEISESMYREPKQREQFAQPLLDNVAMIDMTDQQLAVELVKLDAGTQLFTEFDQEQFPHVDAIKEETGKSPVLGFHNRIRTSYLMGDGKVYRVNNKSGKITEVEGNENRTFLKNKVLSAQRKAEPEESKQAREEEQNRLRAEREEVRRREQRINDAPKATGDFDADVKAFAEYAENFQEFTKLLNADMLDVSDRNRTRIARAVIALDPDAETAANVTQLQPSMIEDAQRFGTPEERDAANAIASEGDSVTIYRAMPASGKIEAGDWVGLVKRYAKGHESNTTGEKAVTRQKKVNKEDLYWYGADFNEWVYIPKGTWGKYESLQDVWDDLAPGKPLRYENDLLRQEKPDTGTARGYYDPENSIIRLTESADLSTFLHEFSHFMYEMELQSGTELGTSINNWYKRNAEDVAAEATKYLNGQFDPLKQGERTTEDKTINEASVVNYLETGTTGNRDKDAAIRRATHEQFARGFETYLMEGKAPSIELRNAFRTFARWLSQIYQSLRGQLNVKLDNEMRQVFDRLLATEEQIAAAESRARVEPMFTDAAMAGMTAEEFADYQKRQEKVKDVQSETLRDQLIKSLTRKTKQWWKEEKADLVDEEMSRLSGEKVYATAARLRHIAKPDEEIQKLIAGARDEVKSMLAEVAKAEKQIKQIQKDNDTIGQFLAKKGGLNRESMVAEGVDPEHFKDKSKVFGRPLFPKNGGMTTDDVAELLNQYDGYSLDANEALDVIFEVLDGDTKFVEPDVNAKIEDIENNIQNIENEIMLTEEEIQLTEQDQKFVNIKLDHATVKEMVGEEKTDKLGRTSTRIPDKLRGMTAKGQKGVHPDEAAAFLGYNSGSEMLNDLIIAPPIKETAETNAEAMMIERHGDPFTDGTIEQLANEAVMNEERGKLILHELKVLARGTNQRTLDRQTMKSVAEERIGQLSFREIHPGKYRKAEIRAAQESARMLAEGNKEGAAQAKQRQALNYYLGMAATEAKNETTKIVDRMARYNKKKVREEIQKAEGGYWNQITKILERFEFKKSASLKDVDQINQDINTWAAERMDTHGDGLVLANVVLNESYVTHWKNVAYSDLQGINDSVKNIEHVARYSNKLTRMGEEIEYNNLVSKLVTTAEETGTGRFKKKASTADDVSWAQRKGRWAMGQMTKIPFMMSWMDGMDRVGTWFTTFSQPMTDAYNAELEMYGEVGKPVADMIQNRSKEDMKRHNTTYFIPEIKDTAGGTHTGNLKGHEILAVALNTGNEGNLRKLLLGEQWAQEDGTDINLQNEKLQAVLKHMTKSDWQMVQKIWDQIDILYPKLAEVHRKTTGLVPPKVEATPVVTEHGTFKGGYYPVKYDPTRDHKAAEFEERKDAEVGSMFASNASIQASVNTGSTNERTGYYAPMHLTLNVVPNHIQETIHYITHHDAVREVNRLLRDPRVKKAVTEKLGPEEFAQLKPWLNDIAKDGRNAPNKSIVDAMFNKLRLGTTLGVMGFKASTGIIQISGLSNALAEVGTANTMQAMRTILGSTDTMQSAWEFAVENSKVMKHRTETMDREIMNAMQQLESKRGVLAAVQEASMKHIALIQTYMVDLPTWHASYIKGMKDWGDETRAFQYADWVVENVQGSGATKDMAALMRNQTKTHTIFTMFMTFFSSLWNMERDLVKGGRSGAYSTTTVASKAMFLFVIPVLFEMMMRGEFSKEDETEEEQLQRMLTSVALYPVQSVPFVRDIVNGVVSGYGYNASPVTSQIEQGLQGLEGMSNAVLADGEITKGQAKAVSKLAGIALGVPGTGQAWATGEHLYDVIAEGEDFTTHQLLFGPDRK
ncbi:coil containing protein [Vibrio phage 1.185.O._10N.286.49.C2]|nr:coil containing protein [Vibrio phage 1.185.O._10N.286.49.C2]